MIANKLKLLIKELINKTINISNTTKNLTLEKFYILSLYEITDKINVFLNKQIKTGYYQIVIRLISITKKFIRQNEFNL